MAKALNLLDAANDEVAGVARAVAVVAVAAAVAAVVAAVFVAVFMIRTPECC
jgi:hypothetical protein